MSWKEKIENIQFTITTGDGKEFKPLWKSGAKSKSYNASNYDFINVSSGFTDRKQPQAAKFPLVFFFQGEDNIEQAQSFEDSADDKRPWTIKHPFYGNITGQPLNLLRSDSSYNVTEITVDFWESINADFPAANNSTNDVIKEKTASVSNLAATNYEAKVEPGPADVQTLQNSILENSSAFDSLFSSANSEQASYETQINSALNNAANVGEQPLEAISSIQELSRNPSLLVQPVLFKIQSLQTVFNKMVELVSENETVNNNLYFEANSAAVVASMCQCTTVSVDGDYITSAQIEEITSIITENYNNYLSILDGLQVDISESLGSYMPDPLTQTALYDLVSETTANLYILAFNAKQERTVEVLTDTNIVLLCHRYMGLDVLDKNIENFRTINNIKNENLFAVKKGTMIKYFV
jgi:hypothetical protein